MSNNVRLEVREGVATITLNRSEAFNALNLATVHDLGAALVECAGDSTARALVLTGAGRAFCSGGDLKHVLAHREGPAAALHELAGAVHVAVREIRRIPKPVVAAVNGVAAGGGFSLALACDFRVMARGARLKQAYTSSGLCIDAGGTFTLPRLAGLARALEIVALDPEISAEQALAWGLATRIAADDAVLAEATSLARTLAARALHAFGLVKRLLTDSYGCSLETVLEREREAITRSAAHAEGREGIRAFVEKRPPRFG